MSDRKSIRITRLSGDPEVQSQYNSNSWKMKLIIKEFFRVIMFYC